MRVSHAGKLRLSSFVQKGMFCITCRAHERGMTLRTEQTRLRLFSPETIQQQETSFKLGTEPEPPAPINKSLFKVLWKEIKDGEWEQTHKNRLERQRQKKQIHLIWLGSIAEVDLWVKDSKCSIDFGMDMFHDAETLFLKKRRGIFSFCLF